MPKNEATKDSGRNMIVTVSMISRVDSGMETNRPTDSKDQNGLSVILKPDVHKLNGTVHQVVAIIPQLGEIIELPFQILGRLHHWIFECRR